MPNQDRLRDIDEEDFEEMAKLVRIEGECHVWIGKVYDGIPDFYGHRPHKLIFERNGRVAKGKIMRSCGNSLCINPEHLYDGKGGAYNVVVPMLKGEEHANHKLTKEEVSEICVRLDKGEGQRSIAADYGVDRTTISSIARGVNWNWHTGRGK